MSKNNTLKKSEKKFIRLEKARIRRQFFDIKKQEEMIDQLYKKFIKLPRKRAESHAESRGNEKKEVQEPKKIEAKKEEKAKPKKEKIAKKAK